MAPFSRTSQPRLRLGRSAPLFLRRAGITANPRRPQGPERKKLILTTSKPSCETPRREPEAIPLAFIDEVGEFSADLEAVPVLWVARLACGGPRRGCGPVLLPILALFKTERNHSSPSIGLCRKPLITS